MDIDYFKIFSPQKIEYPKGSYIFFEGDTPLFFYIVVEGCIKMINVDQEGKQFIQGIFRKGDCFGEPVLFIDKKYPASAVAVKDSTLYKVPKEDFLRRCKTDSNLLMYITTTLSQRLYSKSAKGRIMSNLHPKDKLKLFLESYKSDTQEGNKTVLEITRQQLADILGMRIETVIRNIKKFEEEGYLQVLKGKVHFK